MGVSNYKNKYKKEEENFTEVLKLLKQVAPASNISTIMFSLHWFKLSYTL